MISVLNRLLPLSGSKFYILLLFFTASSCSIARNSPVGKVEKPAVPEPKPVVQEEVLPDPDKKEIPVKEKNLREIEFKGVKYMVPPSKSAFEVALILPFQVGFTGAIAQKRGQIMYEYYSGVLLALKELETEGLQLTLKVFDSQNDTAVLKKLLANGELKNADLIIGPIEQRQMELVSQFASSRKIPVFSPLSVVSTLPFSNTLFYNLQPDEMSRANALAQTIKQEFPGKKLLISGDGKKTDLSFRPLLISALKNNGIAYEEIPGGKWVEWSKYLSEKGTPLYIGTEDQNHLSVVLGKLISSGREPVVFGDQKWLEFTNNDFSFWEKLQVHIVSSSNESIHDPALSRIREDYVREFEQAPGRFALLGYDHFRFVGELLMAFGTHFPTFVNGHSFQYSVSCYNFLKQNGVQRNQGACVFKFSEGALNRIDLLTP